MASKANIRTLRQILSELRHIDSTSTLKDNFLAQYVLKQFRKYKTTSEQLCKPIEEMEFIANTYLCYLKSSRLHREINEQFHGKGERSIADTAKLVGFKLPHEPK